MNTTSIDQRPLAEQPTRNLIVLLFVAALGIPLRHELREPGISDVEAIRAALRRREWAVAP